MTPATSVRHPTHRDIHAPPSRESSCAPPSRPSPPCSSRSSGPPRPRPTTPPPPTGDPGRVAPVRARLRRRLGAGVRRPPVSTRGDGTTSYAADVHGPGRQLRAQGRDRRQLGRELRRRGRRQPPTSRWRCEPARRSAFTYDHATHRVGVAPAELPRPRGHRRGQRAGGRRRLRAPLTRERFYFVMADRFANGDPANDTGGLDRRPAGTPGSTRPTRASTTAATSPG